MSIPSVSIRPPGVFNNKAISLLAKQLIDFRAKKDESYRIEGTRLEKNQRETEKQIENLVNAIASSLTHMTLLWKLESLKQQRASFEHQSLNIIPNLKSSRHRGYSETIASRAGTFPKSSLCPLSADCPPVHFGLYEVQTLALNTKKPSSCGWFSWWWRRGDLNPCPKITPHRLLRV